MMKKAVIILLLGLIFGCQDDYRTEVWTIAPKNGTNPGEYRHRDIGFAGSAQKNGNGSQIRLRASRKSTNREKNTSLKWESPTGISTLPICPTKSIHCAE